MVSGRPFANQYLLIRWRCSSDIAYQRLLVAVIVLSAAVIVGKGGDGQWHYDHCSGGQRAAPHCQPVIGKRSAQRAWCSIFVASCVALPSVTAWQWTAAQ